MFIAPNDLAPLVKHSITDTRQRMLFCNGNQIASNKRYVGLHCCGDFAMCAYVDDDYLSGWNDEWQSGDVYGVDRKYTPHPSWGDRQPPPASDREMWDYYKALYPGFAVDVFHNGASVGTFNLSDANSPIYYDKLVGGWVWQLLGMRHTSYKASVGDAPWMLEGTPKCSGSKLLIPYDGGITTVVGNTAERRVFP